MKEGDAFFLGVRLKVDQEIAADDQVETGKGRVSEEIMFGKHYELPYLLVDRDGEAVLGRGEELRHVIRWHVGCYACRVYPFPCPLQGPVIHVGGEDLYLPLCASTMTLPGKPGQWIK